MRRILFALGIIALIAGGCSKSAGSGQDSVLATAAAKANSCLYNASLVEDAPLPTGTAIPSQATITKTWQVSNTGTCDWRAGIQLVYVSGAPMGSNRVASVPMVKVGDSATISVNLTVPSQPGDYSAEWQLRGPDGRLFGPKLPVHVVIADAINLTKTAWALTKTGLPTPTPTLFSTSTFFSVLNKLANGQNSPMILVLQYLLRANGYTLDADGYFGPVTEMALQDFQARNGLTQENTDFDTWMTLTRSHPLKLGDQGDAVWAAQTLLASAHGYDIAIDGIYGSETENAVRSLQADAKLDVDGIVGPMTWAVLFSTSLH
ncbi:MAG TPA: peptidoglycan-binding protein [Anaerolineales bacterium]|nr:peptidoglycan-binding protein [Anaerolineales bacterium]